MNCPNCGKVNLVEARFCYSCGYAFPYVAPETAPAPARIPEIAPELVQTPPSVPTYPAYNYQLQPNYAQPAYYPAPSYNSGYTPAFVTFHPLAQGAQGLAPEVWNAPQDYYSYINSEGRLVLARKADFSRRLIAGLGDYVLASIPGWVAAIAYINSNGGNALPNTTISPNGAGVGTNSDNLLNILFGAGAWWVSLIALVFFYGYFLIMTATTGQTLFKIIFGIKVIRYDGKRPDLLTAFLRQCLGYCLSLGVIFLGLLWSAWDPRRQGWHDKLARTYVVNKNELIEGRDFTLP
jgi:uncharacterized RDD family membrane protein YckC